MDNNTYEETKGETHVSLQGPRKTELHADDHLTLHADSHVKVGRKWLGKASEEIQVETGQRMVLEAGSGLTVKAGGFWLKVDAGGVHMGGTTINIAGGGAAGSGTPAEPLRPVPPALVCKYIRDFILKDEGGVAADTPYAFILNNGKKISGITDAQGRTTLQVSSGTEPVQLALATPTRVIID